MADIAQNEITVVATARQRIASAVGKLSAKQWKALFAGGGVAALGVGIAFAAWTDEEFANRQITTAKFDLEVNVNGSDWLDYSTSPGGSISVVSGTVGSLTPGDTVYALVRLRQKSPASLPATVSVNGAAPTGDADLHNVLRYTARSVIGDGVTACTAANFTGTFPNALSSDEPLAVKTVGTVTVQPTETLNVCFAVTMQPTATTAAQNKTATAIWRFGATSA